MLIRTTRDELVNFGTPDFTIYNAGAFPANGLTSGMGSTTSIDLRLKGANWSFLAESTPRSEERSLHP